MVGILQWFLTHHGTVGPWGSPGRIREQPYNPDLTAPGGVALATRYIQWVGVNTPGYEYPEKKNVMVCIECN